MITMSKVSIGQNDKLKETLWRITGSAIVKDSNDKLNTVTVIAICKQSVVILTGCVIIVQNDNDRQQV